MTKKFQKKQCEECEEELDEDVDLSNLLPFMLPGMIGQRDILAENGVVFLSGVLTETKANLILKRLWTYHFMEDYIDPVNLIVNGPGGRADCMWAIVDTMDSIKNEVHTTAMGEIASAMAMIFFAGTQRKISENTLCMIHNFIGGEIGNYPELVASRKGTDLEYKLMIKHLIHHSKYNTETDIKKYLLKDQDHWLSASELKKHGLVDYIFKNKKRKK